MKNTYWNGSGTYQDKINSFKELVPAIGKADTVAGEIFRAMSNIYYDGYDGYDNGFCNNYLSSANYLISKILYPDYIKHFLETVTDDTEEYYPEYTDKYILLEKFADLTIEYLLDNENLLTTLNDTDSLDFED